VRPPLTVAASEAAGLQLAVLEEAVGRRACARCDEPVEDEWVACPACGSTLAVRCAACRRPLELDWRICAWCAAEVPWAEGGAGDAASAPGALEPVAIPIWPGGRPLVPVMALPDDDGEDTASVTPPARRPAAARRRRRD
jgi:RNA polymerase subunit RPABC4/transcription elongation factor Spt4